MENALKRKYVGKEDSNNGTLKKLFSALEKIYIKDEDNAKKTGYKVSIFEMLDVKTNERKICHFIYELLNPNGYHLKNELFLKLFLKDVIKLDDKLISSYSYNVWYEYPIYIDKTKRWIDLYIESINGEVKIPIEAKIWAKDQDKQCYDYYNNVINGDNKNKFLYYLTVNNHWPTVASLDDMWKKIKIFNNRKWTEIDKIIDKKIDDNFIFNNKNIIDINGIKRITFQGEIVSWLVDCISELKKNNPKNKIIDILNQFIVNIKEFSGTMEDKAIVEILNKNRKYYRLYRKMKEAEFAFKKERMNECLKEIKDRIKDECDLDEIPVDDFEEQQSNYLKEDQAYPRVEWELKKEKNEPLYLCVEFSNYEDYDVVVGLRIRKENKKYCQEIYKKINKKEKNEDKDNKNWIEFESIKVKNKTPSFSKGNEAFCELLENKKSYNEFIKAIVDSASKYVNRVRKNK